MTIINSVLAFFIKKRIQQIEHFIQNPIDVQRQLLASLLSDAKHTEFGKKYGFEDIRNADQFRERIPIQDYSAIKPYITRLRQGEQNLLWPSEIKWFAKSSGTTEGKSKFIPVSQEALEECHFKGGKDMLSIYLNNRPESKLFDGKGLAMGGSHNITEFNNEEYYEGDLSAIIIQNMPFWAQFKKTPNLSIALMPEWENKIEQMAQITSNHNVTSISGVPSWTLVLIQKIFELKGVNNLAEVWPDLEVFFHGGVSFDPYRNQFKDLIRTSNMSYLETYNASEGFFGIQDQMGIHEMLLMLDYGVYYEFIPSEEIDSENPKTLTLDEVDTNTNYAIVISTNAGLWRYMIGDTIRFTSLNPYRIKISGRTKNFINAFGEELIIENAEKALREACKQTNAQVRDYTAAPIYFSGEEKGAHQWLIEFERDPNDLHEFTHRFDLALQAENSDYEAKRYKDMILQVPKVHALPKQTFYQWMKSRDKLGGQHKVPRLSNNREYIDDILSMVPKQ